MQHKNRKTIKKLHPSIQTGIKSGKKKYHKFSKRNDHRSVLSSLMLAALVIAYSLSGIGFNPGRAKAINNFTQDDWSGGLNSGIVSPSTNQHQSEVYNTTLSDHDVTIGATDTTNWCNTLDCDNNWQYRRGYSFYNEKGSSSETIYDLPIKITVQYDLAMKSDFSDLRVSNYAGDTDLVYWIQSKVDSDTATVWVLNPVVTGAENTIYAYWGNANASSLSNQSALTFTDRFRTTSGNTDPVGWGSCGNISYTNGEAILAQGCGLGVASPTGGDNSVTYTGEYELKMDLSVLNPGYGQGGANYIKVTNAGSPTNEEFSIGQQTVDNGNDNIPNQWMVSNLEISSRNDLLINFNPNDPNTPKFNSNQWVKFKFINYAPGSSPSGVELFYSLDGGTTFTKYDSFQPNDTAYPTMFQFQADQLPMSVRNVIAYHSEQEVSPAIPGVKQYFGGRIGSLRSPFIDFGTKAYFGNIHYTKIGTGEVGVKFHTWSSDPAGSGGYTYYNSTCNLIENGTAIYDATSCAHRGQQYGQYEIILSDDGTHTIGVTDVTVEYDNDLLAPTTPSNSV
ncbi:MAG: DUF2341 domain-containing protein [bacterium]